MRIASATSILNLGDGTVVVQMEKAGKPVFVHEDEMLPVNGNGSLTSRRPWPAELHLGRLDGEAAWTYVRK